MATRQVFWLSRFPDDLPAFLKAVAGVSEKRPEALRERDYSYGDSSGLEPDSLLMPRGRQPFTGRKPTDILRKYALMSIL
jgi:hypothetical protein